MSFLSRLLGTAPDPRESVRPLWHRVIELARDADYYNLCHVADSIAGRFDMITAVLVDPGHRLHGAVTRSLAGIIETKARPSNKKIWNALVAGVRDGMSASDVARELGISKAAVSQAKEAHRHHRQGRHRHEPEAARPAPGRARAWAAWPCPSWKGSAVEHVVGRGQVELEKFGDGLEAFDLREVEAHEHKCTSTRWGGPSCRWRTT